jgi:hypothetical protein
MKKTVLFLAISSLLSFLHAAEPLGKEEAVSHTKASVIHWCSLSKACLAYIRGVADGVITLNNQIPENNKYIDRYFCPPNNFTSEEAVTVIKDYIDVPSSRYFDLKFGGVAIVALREKFPCK